MTHWGWYWKVKLQHTPKALCSQFPRVDSFDIARRVLSTQPMSEFCTITYGENAQKITIEKQACHRGGSRYFFRCPQCQTCRRMLYITTTVACRVCLRLGYRTQRQTPSGRALNRHDKIVDRLEKRGGSLSMKPPGMHSSTWKQLVHSAYHHEINHRERLCAELRSYYPAYAAFIG